MGRKQNATTQTSKDNASAATPPLTSDDEDTAQQALQTSMNRFRALAASSADFLWIMAADGNMKEESSSWCAFTGQKNTEATGKGWLALVHPNDQRRCTAAWKTAAKTCQPCEIECRIRHYDGVYHACRIQGVPVQETDGCIGEWIGIGTDISERKQLEQREAERTSQLEAIFEAMTDSVYVYDREGRIVQMNAAARVLARRIIPVDTPSPSFTERLTQVRTYNEHGQPLPPEQWPMSRIFQGEVLTPAHAADIVFRDTDGRDIYTNVTGGPLHDAEGHIIGAVAISRDVTERRRLEQVEYRVHAETQSRLALLQLILDELPMSVYLVHGQDARLILANRATTALWGAQWTFEQPLEEFLQEHGIRVFSIDGRPLTAKQYAPLHVLSQDNKIYQQQEIIRHADGTTLPVLVNAITLDLHHLSGPLTQSAIYDDAVAEPTAIVVHQDVTALKDAERLKDEFISIAAHELRTPLAVLKGFVQTLIIQTARGKGPTLSDWQQEALQSIDQATSRLVNLTDDLLDVTRLQAGKLALHSEPTDIVALTRRVIKRLQMTTEQHKISIATPLDYLVTQVDPGRIEQVLTNLIGNAIKYSPDGGSIEVMISQEAGTNDALVSIRDYGIGIPQQQQPHIFERFVRADNANAHGISGTGLGLYLCRELIERHGGRLWFESTEGQGSIFFMAVPIILEDGSLL